MQAIKLLDNQTINKIAAGEVVERPASVVKELVENSIDANASAITVEIKDGGISMIRITDNGVGIPKDNVVTAFLRHATSKIENDIDLESISSLGFRGEALASIAAVSQIEVITKVRTDITGKRIEMHGGELLAEDEVACPEGTTIIMKNLFYNTPPRRKFLNSSRSEAAKISNIVYKLALAHPEISFKYINNNKPVFNTAGDHKLKNCVMNVYGKDIARQSIEINYTKEDITLFGLIGKPVISRGNRSYENFFINGRYIESKIIQQAVEDAYKTVLTIGRFPVVILHLQIPSKNIDVNVHPTKMEVRFTDEDPIYNFVYKSIRQALTKENLIPQTSFKPISRDPLVKKEKSKQQTLNEPFNIKRKENNKPTIKTMMPSTEPSNIYSKQAKRTNLFVNESNLVQRNYNIIGQFFNTYWMLEIKEKLYVIDQHAAHERILYEELLNNFKLDVPDKQTLIEPITINVSPGEKLIIKKHKKLLNKFGFEIEEFGSNAYISRTVPMLFNSPAKRDIFTKIIDQLIDNKLSSIYETQVKSIASMACQAAVKAYDKLSPSECRGIINQLMKLENPYTCPHGRPTIISVSKINIEKKFKRI